MKLTPAASKLVKSDSKIINSLYKSNSMAHTVIESNIFGKMTSHI